MSKNIVVEGLDGTGKSTLASALHQNNPSALKFVSEGPATPNEFWRRNAILRELCESKSDVICDRHPAISEHVYGDICRNTGPLIRSHLVIALLEEHSIDRIVYCRSRLSTLKIEARDDDSDREMTELVKKNLMFLHFRYEALMALLKERFEVMEIDALHTDPNKNAKLTTHSLYHSND